MIPRRRRYPLHPITRHKFIPATTEERRTVKVHSWGPVADPLPDCVYVVFDFVNSTTSTRPLPFSQGEPQ